MHNLCSKFANVMNKHMLLHLRRKMFRITKSQNIDDILIVSVTSNELQYINYKKHKLNK
jgi:hypothetical protein